MNRRSPYSTRRTDDGSYPNVDEERAKVEERLAAGVTVSEMSTTWQHGHVKCIMHTSTKDGKTSRTVKVIDVRPGPRSGGNHNTRQWEGTFEEFVEHVGSLNKLFPLVQSKRDENKVFKNEDGPVESGR